MVCGFGLGGGLCVLLVFTPSTRLSLFMPGTLGVPTPSRRCVSPCPASRHLYAIDAMASSTPSTQRAPHAIAATPHAIDATHLSQRDAGHARWWRRLRGQTLRHFDGRPGPGLLHVRGDALDLCLNHSRPPRHGHGITTTIAAVAIAFASVSLPHWHAIAGTLSRTSSRHGTPSTRRSKKDAVSHARRERALFNFVGVLDGRLGHADGLWVSGGGRRGEVDARGFAGRRRVGACERRAASMLYLSRTGTPSLRRSERTPCHARFARRIALAGASSSLFGVGASSASLAGGV